MFLFIFVPFVSLHAFKRHLPCCSWSRSPVCYVVFHHESCWLHALLLVLSLSAVPYQLRKRSFLAFTGVFLSFWLLSTRVSPSYPLRTLFMLFTGAVPKGLHSKPRSFRLHFHFSRCFVRRKLSCCHEKQSTLETVYFAWPERPTLQMWCAKEGVCNKLQGKKKIPEVAFFSLYICLASCCITSLTKLNFCNCVQLWSRSTKYRCKYQAVFNTAPHFGAP